MAHAKTSPQKIAFFVGEFPTASVTFIINQIVDLLDRGIDVHIFAFKRGSLEHVSKKFFEYNLEGKTTYLDVPQNVFVRLVAAVPLVCKLVCTSPMVFLRACNVKKYNIQALSLRTIFWASRFIDTGYDVIHCHLGTVANKFLIIRELVKNTTPMVTTFYGYDVSHIPHVKGGRYYDRLKDTCRMYFVMSTNMKERVLALGFREQEVHVLPVSIAIDTYPFRERKKEPGRPVKAVTVARLVEKKGIDDLIRAAHILKGRHTPVSFEVIGGGPLEQRLRKEVHALGVDDMVVFRGPMAIEHIIKVFEQADVYVQPSKTAVNGDME